MTRPSGPPTDEGLSAPQRAAKRAFDLVGSAAGLALVGWAIPLLALGARRATGASGLFRQARVGRFGATFDIVKIRTMAVADASPGHVTVAGDPRIGPYGRFLRRHKLDELPQLLNVLRGHMSFVGPRPDVPGFADELEGADRLVLTVRPGITGPASLRFRDEEQVLASVEDPDRYNREVLWPQKVAINLDYVRRWSFAGDLRCMARTLRGSDAPAGEAIP